MGLWLGRSYLGDYRLEVLGGGMALEAQVNQLLLGFLTISGQLVLELERLLVELKIGGGQVLLQLLSFSLMGGDLVPQLAGLVLMEEMGWDENRQERVQKKDRLDSVVPSAS